MKNLNLIKITNKYSSVLYTLKKTWIFIIYQWFATLWLRMGAVRRTIKCRGIYVFHLKGLHIE